MTSTRLFCSFSLFLATIFGLVSAGAGDVVILGVPDWNQPADYGIEGYADWCAPTTAANIVGYWEDRFGLVGLADRQAAPASPTYPDNPGTWMQGLFHDGTIEMGLWMGTGDWGPEDGQFPPNPSGTVFTPIDNAAFGVYSYAMASWTDVGGLEKMAFAHVALADDRQRGPAMWANYRAEIDAGRPVLCGFSGWVGETSTGTTTVGSVTVHHYEFGTTLGHAVCGVGYIDPTPEEFNGDERIIAQDTWPETPRYVAVPVDSQWQLNDYFRFSAVVDSSSDEGQFALAAAGRTTATIDFDRLIDGETIDDQFASWATFLAADGGQLSASDAAWGVGARSGPLCVEVPEGAPSIVDILFDRPVVGASVWVLHEGVLTEAIDVAAYDLGGTELATYRVDLGAGYSHVALLADVDEIARLRLSGTSEGVRFGIDDLTLIAPVPEPSASSVLLVGIVFWGAFGRKRRRAG